ncbi:MAG: glycosyltransferase family 39 protein [Acidobacteriota bacterium]
MTKKRENRPKSPKPARRFARASQTPDRTLQDPPSEDRALAIPILAFIGMVALALRLANLFRPMDYDEAFTFLHYASQPLAVGLADYSLPNNHLFHTLLVHVCVRLFGNHPWVIRLPAFCAGVALVPGIYFWIRRLFHERAALLAAAFVAVSDPLVSYSTNARGYTILGLCFVAAFTLAARLLRRDRPRDWIAFVAISAAGFYTIPTMIYGFGTIVLWLGVEILRESASPARRVLLRHTLLAILAVAVLAAAAYAPIGMRSGFGALTASAFESLTWPRFLDGLAGSLQGVWEEWNRSIPGIVAMSLGLCALAAVIFHRRFSSFRFSPAIPALVWPVLLLLVQRTVPFSRVWLYLLPLYFGTACAGLAALLFRGRLAPRTRRILLACTVIAVELGLGAAVFIRSRANFEDPARVDRICDFLTPQLRTGDLVGANGYWATPIAYYLSRGDVPVERLSTDWRLEVLQVVPSPGATTPQAPTRPPRAFFVIRSSDTDTLEMLRREARAAGVAPTLTVLKRFGTTTVYEDVSLNPPGP